MSSVWRKAFILSLVLPLGGIAIFQLSQVGGGEALPKAFASEPNAEISRSQLSGRPHPVSTSIAQGSETATTGSTFCPFQTPEEWRQFLERAIDHQNWVETCEDSPCDEHFYKFVKNNVADVFAACSNFIKTHPEIAECTDRFRRYAPTWLAQHSPDTYGFTVNNYVYLARQDAPDKPENMMKIPDAIVQALPDRSRVEKAAQDNGWYYLTHDSALGGFRTFVVVSDPQGRFDQWMLLNLRDKNNEITQGTPLSILTVQKKTKSGEPLSKVRLHFRDYVIEHSPAKKYRVVLNETINGKCYSCHSNGVRQLISRETPILEARPVKGEEGYDPHQATPLSRTFAYARLLEMNRRLRSYGQPDWAGDVIPENHGPPLGKQFGCMECHDGQSRSTLTISTSLAQLQQKVVTELSMPPDSNLPDKLKRSELKNPPLGSDESLRLEQARQIHQGIENDFEKVRYTELKDWLLNTSCK